MLLTKKVDIADFGDLFGDPNMIDTTHLGNRRQTQISGTLAGDSIPFTVFYTKASMKTCRADEDKPLYFALTFQDGSGWVWQGDFRISQSGKGVDEAIDFTINSAASTDLEWFEDETDMQNAFDRLTD